MIRHLLTAGFTVPAFSQALWALDEPPDKSKPPRERYQSPFREHQKAMETFMQAYQAILETNPDRDHEAKGQACLALGQKRNGPNQEKKAEAMFERAENELGDVDTSQFVLNRMG